MEGCECTQAVINLWARVKGGKGTRKKEQLTLSIIQVSASLQGEWPSLTSQYNTALLSSWPTNREYFHFFEVVYCSQDGKF